MDILKDNWDSPLEFVASLFNTYYNIYIFLNQNHIQYLPKNFINNTNVFINEILSNPFISISFAIIF
jgi:hypothetical protein